MAQLKRLLRTQGLAAVGVLAAAWAAFEAYQANIISREAKRQAEEQLKMSLPAFAFTAVFSKQHVLEIMVRQCNNSYIPGSCFVRDLRLMPDPTLGEQYVGISLDNREIKLADMKGKILIASDDLASKSKGWNANWTPYSFQVHISYEITPLNRSFESRAEGPVRIED